MTQYVTVANNAARLDGMRFGRLVALGPVGRRNGSILWLCQCDCGNTATVISDSLKRSATRSCGCLQRERVVETFTIHGQAKSQPYTIWNGIVQRCTKPNYPHYPDYGGRGITLHPAWLASFDAFHTYISSLPNHGKDGYSLDRIDNDGNYEPGNLRYATRSEQMRNARSVHLLAFGGKTQCLQAWAEELGIDHRVLRGRIRKGWSVERALTTPKRAKKSKSKCPDASASSS